MGKAQRDKGKRGERAAANLLRRTFPHLADSIRRGWQSRFGGKDEPDIMGLPWHVEVKVGKSPNIPAAVKQALRDSKNGPILVMTKRDHEGWLVTMRYEDWEELARGHE